MSELPKEEELATVIPQKIPLILAHPQAVLKKVAKPVDFKKEKKEDLQRICEDLNLALQMVTYGQKLGLAAPQIGVSKRIFIMFGLVIINPEWRTTKVPQTVSMNEGCYSCPSQVYKTQRVKYGWASWYNIDGIRHEVKLKGLEAIVFQHEMQHLDGKCLPDIGTLFYTEPRRTPEEVIKEVEKHNQ